jgi:hypothetical protein
MLLSCKKGGTGGTTNIVTIVTHHGKAIPNATVYIKYGSYNYPGSDASLYNASQITGPDGYTNFKGLQYGYYQFYAVGFDSTSVSKVSGNAGIKVKHKDKAKELELGISVTEE